MLRSILRPLALVAAVALAPPGASAATIGAERLYAFGDSLTDTGIAFALTGGRVPASPPYFDGRFSNGPIWIDAVAADFAAERREVRNYAVGGATAVGGLGLQIGAFALEKRATAGAVAALFAGSNDLNAIVDNQRSGLLPRIAAEEAARIAARSVGASARALAELGVTRFVIFNAPKLGAVPRYALERPDRVAFADRASAVFNAALAGSAASLRSRGLSVAEIDVFALLEDARLNPGTYGFTNVSDPCLAPAGTICSDPGGYLFWDNLHPTTAAHAILAAEVRRHLAPVPIPLPAPALLLLLGLAGLGWLAGPVRPQVDRGAALG